MQINIDTLEEFDTLARAMNYTPQKEALQYAQSIGHQIAKDTLIKAGFKVQEGPPAADGAPTATFEPAPQTQEAKDQSWADEANKQIASPPGVTDLDMAPADGVLDQPTPRKTRKKKEPEQIDLVEFAKQGAPPKTADVVNFPKSDDINSGPKPEPEMASADPTVAAHRATLAKLNNKDAKWDTEDVRHCLRGLAAQIHLDASRALLKHFDVPQAKAAPLDKIAAIVAASRTTAKTVEAYTAELKAVPK